MLRGVWEEGVVEDIRYDEDFNRWIYKIRLNESKKQISNVEEWSLKSKDTSWCKLGRSRYSGNESSVVAENPFEVERIENHEITRSTFDPLEFGWKIYENRNLNNENSSVRMIGVTPIRSRKGVKRKRKRVTNK